MTFCTSCGSAVDGKFCPKCGKAIGEAVPPPDSQAYAGGAAPTASAAPLGENIAGALCYLLTVVTGVLFLLIAPYNQNKFVRFHAFQSIFFFLALVVISLVSSILTWLLPWFMMPVWGIISLLIWLASVAVWVILMVKAFNHERFRLPIVGDLADKQA